MNSEPSDLEYSNAIHRIEAHPEYQREIHAPRTVRTDSLAYRWVVVYWQRRQMGETHEQAIRYTENRICLAAIPSFPPMWDIPVSPPPLMPDVPPRLVVRGKSFVDMCTGQLWPWRSVTAWHLFQAWLDGDTGRVRDYAEWMRANGITMGRVTSMYNGGLGRFIPAEYPSYWTGMDEFFESMGAIGLAIEFTIFCDTQRDGLKLINQADHYVRVRDIVTQYPHVVIEIVNERWANGVDVLAVMKPDIRIVQATGAYDEADAGTYTYPVLDYMTDHTPRDDEWPRKARRLQETGDAIEAPCVADEPFGIGRIEPPPASQSRSLVASDHAQYHALASLCGAGSTIHGSFANQLRLPDAEEQKVVDAITGSWAIIPADVHETWRYGRPGLAWCPMAETGSLRTYTMTSPDGQRAWAVDVRPIHAPRAADGWRIVAERGFGGCVIECARI